MLANRLGNCNVCDEELAKYTCPGCAISTCSVQCVKAHKVDYECDGVRDKTAYIPLAKFTNLDLLSDYRLLEDVSRSVDNYSRDPKKKMTITEYLPQKLFRLRFAAHRRNMRLWFLPELFTRHSQNTSHLDWDTKVIYWKIKLTFVMDILGKKVEIQEDPVSEDNILNDIILDAVQKSLGCELNEYQTSDPSEVKILLQSENIKNAKNRFFALQGSLSLRANLEGHTLVEYPRISVVLKKYSEQYNIVTPEEIIAEERDRFLEEQQQKNELEPAAHEDVDLASSSKRPRLDIPLYSDLCKMATSDSDGEGESD